MKKLLSLTLVLMLLFTTISFTSVSAAATMDIVLAKADLSNVTIDTKNSYFKDIVVTGTDALFNGNGNSRWASNSAAKATETVGDVTHTYNANTVFTPTTSTEAGIEAGIGANVPILKLTQNQDSTIVRMFMTDGTFDAPDTANGEYIEYRVKMYMTDFISHSAYTAGSTQVPAVKMDTPPSTHSWKVGRMDNSGGRKGSSQTIATGEWVQIIVKDNNTTSGGIALEGLAGAANNAANYKKVMPATIYFADFEIVKVTPVATNKITAVKLGEGTVTGDGDIVTGEIANLTATPAAGYHFDGWYTKSAGSVSTTCLSKDASYSFTVSEDTEVVAAFEKDAVNSWIELLTIPFEGNVSPAASGINLWGKDASWANVNSGQSYVTYTDEGLTDVPFDGGEKLVKFDSNKTGAVAVTGMVDGRINGIPGYYTRFEEGGKYRMSMWMYIPSTYKGKSAGDEIDFTFSFYSNAGIGAGATAIATVGEWTLVEAVVDSMDAKYANVSSGARIKFSTASSLTAYDETASEDGPTVMYIDNLKFEKFDGVTVSAEATNGTVYGTGSYAKGESVTLNAGADAGYKFAGYYTNDDTLLSAEPKYTFTVNADTNVVAKFVEAEKYVQPSDVLYYYGNEEGDVGIYNTWFYNDKNGDGKVTGKDDPNTTDVVEPNEQNSSEPYNMAISYQELAEEGIYKPNDDAIFGDKLYQQKRLEGDIGNQMSGRFRGWENGSNGVTTKYVSGKQYKFTWWVNPVSMQIANGEETQPATTTLTVSMQYDSSNSSGLSHTFTLNVGEWNKLEWVFTANDKMASIAPGLRYDWGSKTNTETTFLTVTNWALYDAITVEEITEWQFSDTKAPNGGWFRYRDYGDYTGAANSNTSAGKLAPYTDYPTLPKASDDAGNNVVVFDFSEPSGATAANFKPKAGSAYEGKTFEEAYAYLTRVDNAGAQNGGRFNNITTAGTLKIGSTYKLSYKIYVPEVLNMLTGEKVDNPNISARIIGTHTGNYPAGDGKDVYKKLETGKWVEVGYTFKATEKGAECAPSLKFELSGVGVKDGDELTENSVMIPLYFIDDVTVELVHVDDLALEISQDDTTVTATATVNDIKSGNSLKAIVIIAAYDADGKLISVALSSENGEDVALDGSISATYTKADDVDKYVAFLWDDLTNIRPYVLPVTLGE